MLNQVPGTIAYIRQEETEEFGIIETNFLFKIEKSFAFKSDYKVICLNTKNIIGFVFKDDRNFFSQTWFFSNFGDSNNRCLSAYTLKNLKGMIADFFYDI